MDPYVAMVVAGFVAFGLTLAYVSFWSSRG